MREAILDDVVPRPDLGACPIALPAASSLASGRSAFPLLTVDRAELYPSDTRRVRERCPVKRSPAFSPTSAAPKLISQRVASKRRSSTRARSIGLSASATTSSSSRARPRSLVRCRAASTSPARSRAVRISTTSRAGASSAPATSQRRARRRSATSISDRSDTPPSPRPRREHGRRHPRGHPPPDRARDRRRRSLALRSAVSLERESLIQRPLIRGPCTRACSAGARPRRCVYGGSHEALPRACARCHPAEGAAAGFAVNVAVPVAAAVPVTPLRPWTLRSPKARSSNAACAEAPKAPSE